MSSMIIEPAAFEDVAELLDRLGNIPPARIHLRPKPGNATEADVIAALESPRKCLCELIDGVLVEKAMGLRESGLASWISFLLMGFVRPRNPGIITGEQGPLRLFAGRVRMPDVAFISWDRVPDGRWPEEPIVDLIPDLAVEVLSVGNTPAEMRLKRQDYFGAGVLLVWEIDPRSRSIAVYTDPITPILLQETDVLDGAPALPGFTVAVRDVFAELDRCR